MNRFNLTNSILGWITFLISLVVYILTLEPSVSLWDCGEFISASDKLQVVHPPGAPLFLMLGRLFAIFAEAGTNEVAIAVNMLSAVASAATVMLTFWITVHFGKKIIGVGLNDDSLELGKGLSILGAGLVAALSVTFMDTFWFSAVEAEVYASSSCFMALAFWGILRWERIKDQKASDRWIVFVAYIVGLGIGLHLLNLLVIPAIIYYYYFNRFEYSTNNLIKSTLIGFGAIALLQWIVIPKTPAISAMFDRLFVNSFGLPFNSGTLFFIVLLIGAIAYGLYWTKKNSRPIANLVLLCFAFIMLGFSSYSMVVIRSLAEPAIDMNNPEDAHSLLSYINREQYGDRPLLKGPYWNARLVDVEYGGMQYRKGTEGYVAYGEKPIPVYDPRYQTILPRMGDMSEKSQLYPLWSGMDDMFFRIQSLKQQIQQNPQDKDLQRELAEAEMTLPQFSNNMKFMFDYQIGWMYWRYFMWNFAGRQNDLQNIDGNNLDGNWISGVGFVDQARLGPQDNLPKHIDYHKAKNKYYFLPLILGLLGIFFQFRKSQLDFYTVLVMFLFTGVLVVIYLNQPPMEPRERDYTNVGSYQTFCIWIGLGVLFLADLIRKYMNRTTAAVLATVVGLAAAPVLMASENWDDHDRSDRYLGISFAKNYLNSCKPNAILFTNGDNDTYPLWYAQNVEGIRTDVRIINLSLLPTEWYIDALRRKVYDSEPLPMSIPEEKLVTGTRDYTRYMDNPNMNINKDAFYKLDEIIDFMTSDDPQKKVPAQNGERVNYYPTKKFFIPVDKQAVLAAGRVPLKDSAKIVDRMEWNFGRGGMYKGEMVVLDIIATNAKEGWKRPIYWTTTTGSSVFLNLDKYLRHNGLTYELIPVQRNPGYRGMDDMDMLYDKLMNVYVWGNMEKGELFLDDKATLLPKNLRGLFVEVARYYSNQGQHDTAVALLDKCFEVMPEAILPMDFGLKIVAADIYFAAEQNEVGDKYLDEVCKDAAEMVRYLNRFTKRQHYQYTGELLRQNLSALQRAVQAAKQNKRNDIVQRYEAQLQQLQSTVR
ncbi:DUF2723 domain-containing protein [bacterium]|nr:DUF2723 domain-containing protein [bacterium]